MQRSHLTSASLAALTLTALGSRASYFRHNFSLQLGISEAERSDERFRGMAAELRGRKVVGYLGPPDAPVLYLAQYSLAPVTVVRGQAADLVIVDGVDSAGMTEVADFGGGLKLCKK